jgi:hypothetical protein
MSPGRGLLLRHRSYGLMRQAKTLPPTPVPFADGSLQFAANPCWEMALPDVISEFLVQVLGPIPRDVLLVHSPVSSQETPASHLVKRTSHIACSRQCSFNRGAVFEAAVIRLCSGPCTRSASRLHPPRDQTLISGGQALYTTQNSVGCLPRAVASLRTRFRAIGTAGLSPAGIQPCRLLLHHPAPPLMRLVATNPRSEP